ncbi:glycerol-3-phosphate acyltransferase PlsY [Evansella caseinilytica]|uniref:Glycerol-3-phosphate acyltransferase n=1 Tax=Evansella caseinilytica TaxID=1503961 RepID=A0A1H3ISU6_9BACI|nr:glycerol-3-phosphate 1-O-acyltransferase PlsY [Evansella caseinilytica]SDY30627.1 glycerol-3-phosphate acyltransferase PlsY [Evansella caseinilytica]
MVIITAYLIGSVPFALIVGKKAIGADVRNFGSGNLGATNTALVLGKKAGLLVAVGDVGKGALAAMLPSLLGLDVNPVYTGSAVILGHCFPVFASFRGGKAVAPTAGVLLSLNPLMFLSGYITFVTMIFITKYVFIGSLSIGIVLTIHSAAVGENALIGLFAIFSLLMFYLHRSNIRNFFSGMEIKITDKNIDKYREKMKQKLSQSNKIIDRP